jgi:hypothetical protein
MSQFDAAREKYLKRHGTKLDVVGIPTAKASVETVAIETPKEKPRAIDTDGFVEVAISLPGKMIELSFRKRNVMENVNKSKMTREEFRNQILKALEPLLGRVEVL